jgi:hypothetical protein
VNNDFDFDSLDLAALNIEGVEVVTLKEAMALPETGASSAVSFCDSCSSCGSSSCSKSQ